MEQNKTGERCSVICSIVEGNFCNSIIFCGSHNRGKVRCMRHPLPNWGSRGLLCTVIHGMLTRVEVLIVGSTMFAYYRWITFWTYKIFFRCLQCKIGSFLSCKELYLFIYFKIREQKWRLRFQIKPRIIKIENIKLWAN